MTASQYSYYTVGNIRFRGSFRAKLSREKAAMSVEWFNIILVSKTQTDYA